MSREKPSPEQSPENIDSEIEKLLEIFDSFDFNEFSEQVQDRWYDVEMEARVAKDRETAKAHLEEFLAVLENIKKREKIK
ncbi:hypothetical protein KJ969_01735 [Patescibacteria group bacterium]|nr:hypothetical protein [Patescibacteria group bacterium]MBU1921792.1 hypothetical protein [Patescibacteria group bacterium]